MLRGARIVMHLGDVVILGPERRNLCRRVVCSVPCEKKTLITCPRNLCILFIFVIIYFFQALDSNNCLQDVRRHSAILSARSLNVEGKLAAVALFPVKKPCFVGLGLAVPTR